MSLNNRKNIPEELIMNRGEIEGSFIMALWNDTDFYSDYMRDIKPSEHFLLDETKLYYIIGLGMYKKGYNSLDEASVSLYLSDRDDLRSRFDDYGGYRTVKEMMSVLSDADEIDAYYEALVKNNMIINLHQMGFSVLEDLPKLKKMTSEDIYDYYDYILNKVSMEQSTSLEIEDLILTDEFFEGLQAGENIGLQYGKHMPIVNYITSGIHKGDMYLLGGQSGTGKSSKMFHSYVMPVVENGHKTCIISNEQRIKAFQSLLLMYVLIHDLNYFKLNRKLISTWTVSEEQEEIIAKARDIANSKYMSKLKFVRMYDYDNGKIKRVVKRLAKEGFEFFVYDTLKAEDLTEGWAELVESSKELFQLVSKENVAMLTTYQLAPSQLHKRFLDVTTLSNAKQIKEVYSEMVYTRPVWDDEFDGEKFDIKPYELMRDPKTGKYTDTRVYKTLDRNKKYIIAFIDKTRNAQDKQTIVYEWNGDWNQWKEIGYCTVFYDRNI